MATTSNPSPGPDTNKKIIFTCDEHSALVSGKLKSFYEENKLFDTVLIAGSNCVRIQAHRVVLCALSEYFLEKICNGQLDSNSNEVALKEIKASTLKLVIDFMYSGSIELSFQKAEELLRTALFLKIKILVDGCCELIEKNFSFRNSLNWFQLATELNLPKLKAKALECTYIHFEEIPKEKIVMLSENDLKSLLFDENPYGDFEEDLFLSMVAWINHDKLNREHLTYDLLSRVRFQALTPKFIIEHRKPVCKTVESYELICSWLQWHLSPETRRSDQQTCDLKPRNKPSKLAVTKIIDSNQINIETFNFESKTWSTKIQIHLPNVKESFSTIVIDEKLIVVGGKEDTSSTRSVKCCNLQTLEWIDLPPMKKERTNCQLAHSKGYLCVLGEDADEDSNSMEIYNMFTSKWHDLQPLCEPSSSSRIAAHNGMLYMIDFENENLQSYDLSTNKWSSKSVEEDSLDDFYFVAIERYLYVIGYECDDEEYVIKRYNLSNDSWCNLTSLPSELEEESEEPKVTVFENKIIICDKDNIYEYNIDTNTWINLTNNILDVSTISNIFNLTIEIIN